MQECNQWKIPIELIKAINLLGLLIAVSLLVQCQKKVVSIEQITTWDLDTFTFDYFRVSGNFEGIGEQVFSIVTRQKNDTYQPIDKNSLSRLVLTIVWIHRVQKLPSV